MDAGQRGGKMERLITEYADESKSGVGIVARGFTLLYVDMNFGTVNILPDWAGYFLLWKAAGRLGRQEPQFLRLKPLALLLTVFDGACWLAGLFGAAVSVTAVTVIVGIVSLYFEYQFLTELGHLAVRCGSPSGKWFYRLRILRAAMLTFLMLFRTPLMERAAGWPQWIGWSVLAAALVMIAVTAMAVGDLDRRISILYLQHGGK